MVLIFIYLIDDVLFVLNKLFISILKFNFKVIIVLKVYVVKEYIELML